MSDFQVGGQAVIEGVMIRSETHVATAVRKEDKSILVKTRPFRPLIKRYRFLNIPVVRGFLALIEMLIIGIGSLNFSAEIAAQEADRLEGGKGEGKKPSALLMGLTMLVAMALAIGLFFFLPLWIASLFGVTKEALLFNLIAGVMRLGLFVGYVWFISRFKDISRIFQYHGAEHKSVYTHENKEELTIANAAKYTTLHPRCGTSFVMIVAIAAILTFAISDTIYQWLTGAAPALLNRFALHLSLLPLVSGLSYELLKLSAKKVDNGIVKLMIKPGLWLQLITTKEPSEDQLEVALVATRASLGLAQQVEVHEFADA
jgi:uncharacterized protein YqhQ